VTRFFAQALVIARRDFSAIVLTPTFLIFLLAPLFMLAVATIGSLGAVHVVEGSRARAVVIAAPEALPDLRAAEQRLRRVSGTDPGPPPVSFEAPQPDTAGQVRALLGRDDVSAVLSEGQVFHAAKGARDADYLALLAGAASGAQPELRTVSVATRGPGVHSRNAAAFGAVFAMFFLSLLLASQAISMLAEERNNKVIEILAAAVPLEAVFLGKLIGMLGVALLFTLFWGSVAAIAAFGGLGGFSFDAIAPATSLVSFVLLFLGYFMLCFLLLGAVFLGVGAQAGTMREIQMLSLPVTIFQVGMFALASAGAGAPDSTLGVIAAAFPFSSPFAMAGRAAIGVPGWQHVLAFAWQIFWLGVTVTVAARLFRRGVLKSGGGRRA
jgi:ABC-2 type transport system permease protein